MPEATFQMSILMNFENFFLLFKFMFTGTSQGLRIWQQRKERVRF